MDNHRNNPQVKQCQLCNSFTVDHDRRKGNVKCFSCGYIVEDHFQTFEQEVNNYDNDPNQINQMRGIVADGKEDDIRIGDRPLLLSKAQKNKIEEKVNKIRSQMRKWCGELYLDKKDLSLVERQYTILTENIQKQTDHQLKANAVLAIFIAAKILKLEEEVFNLKNLCNIASLKLDKAEEQKEYIIKNIEGIKEILEPQKTIEDIVDQAVDKIKGYLSEKDVEGSKYLCKIILKKGIKGGEQHKTVVHAVLYCIMQLSNHYELKKNGEPITLTQMSIDLNIQSCVAFQTFYVQKLLPEINQLYEEVRKKVQVDWKSPDILKRKQNN